MKNVAFRESCIPDTPRTGARTPLCLRVLAVVLLVGCLLLLLLLQLLSSIA